MSDNWQNEVRVHYDKPAEVAYLEQHQRTEPQKTQDQILDKAAEHAAEALEHVHKSLDWLAVIVQSKNRNVPVYVQQLVEEIAELRRVRR